MAIVNYVVVGGGGAPGNSYAGSVQFVSNPGGGGGQVLTGALNITSNGTLPVVVGAGGVAVYNPFNGNYASANGDQSSFGSITATGTTSPYVSGSGNSNGFSAGDFASPGGGGDSAIGGSVINGASPGANGGTGGAGTTWAFNGNTYGGGGGGGSWNGSKGLGGSGGGGDGATGNSAPGVDGTPNTGGGGGSGSANNGVSGNGGSGIVICYYTTGSIIATGGSITISGGNTVHTFTSSDGFVISGFTNTATGAFLLGMVI